MNIDAILENTREIPEDRNYWFIRTFSGQIYNHFVDNNYVAIGLNDIPVEYLEKAKPGDKQDVKLLRNFILKNTGYTDGSATKFMKQIIQFVHIIKEGDIVMIPSTNSNRYAIGEVQSTDITIHKINATFQFEGRDEPFPEKRKKIKWLKTITSGDFRNDIGTSFVSRSVLANVSKYGEFIESYISTFYVKNQKAYLALTIGQEEDINAFHLYRLLQSLTYFYKEFATEFNEDTQEELYLKIKVQSKGKAIFKAVSVLGIGALATLIAMSNNGKFKFKRGDLEFELESDGFLKSYTDFLDASQERKQQMILLQDSLEALKAGRQEAKSIEKDVTNNPDSEGEENNSEENSEE